MEAMDCDNYDGSALSGPALRDLTVPMEGLELVDWQEDLLEEIDWMREVILAELNQVYSDVCKLLSKKQVADLEEEKTFLEFSLKFLTLTRKDEIKWPKERCSYTVRRIKAYVLHLRKMGLGNQIAKQLEQSRLSTAPPNLKKWPTLASRHDRMYEQFQTLQEKYLPVVSRAFRMYCQLCVERGGKYISLVWHFAVCTAFLRLSRNDLLLISRDEFDNYARKIQIMATGDDTVENLYKKNIDIADASRPTSSNSTVQLEQESTDWLEDLHKEIELMRKSELSDDIKMFYRRVCEKCYESPEAAVEHDQDKRYLASALGFLALTRDAKIEESKEVCFDNVRTIKMYALRYRNEYLIEHHRGDLEGMRAWQYRNPEQIREIEMIVEAGELNPIIPGSCYSTHPPEQKSQSADWRQDAHNEIESTREKYMSAIVEEYRRVCEMLSKSAEPTARDRGEKIFLEKALTLLMVTESDQVMMPKDECFKLLELIELYVRDHRKSTVQHQPGKRASTGPMRVGQQEQPSTEYQPHLVLA